MRSCHCGGTSTIESSDSGSQGFCSRKMLRCDGRSYDHVGWSRLHGGERLWTVSFFLSSFLGLAVLMVNQKNRDIMNSAIRDALVEKIWEGTTTVLALDLVRAARDVNTMSAFVSVSLPSLLSLPIKLKISTVGSTYHHYLPHVFEVTTPKPDCSPLLSP